MTKAFKMYNYDKLQTLEANIDSTPTFMFGTAPRNPSSLSRIFETSQYKSGQLTLA